MGPSFANRSRDSTSTSESDAARTSASRVLAIKPLQSACRSYGAKIPNVDVTANERAFFVEGWELIGSIVGVRLRRIGSPNASLTRGGCSTYRFGLITLGAQGRHFCNGRLNARPRRLYLELEDRAGDRRRNRVGRRRRLERCGRQRRCQWERWHRFELRGYGGV